MEFKQKQRVGSNTGRENNSTSQHHNRAIVSSDHNIHNIEGMHRQSNTRSGQENHTKHGNKSDNRQYINEAPKQKQQQQCDVNFNNAYQQQQKQQINSHQQLQQQAHSNTSTQYMHPQLPTTSNLSQRLQQVQNRNDPSHVGSVQMNALASQNQMVVQSSPSQSQQQTATTQTTVQQVMQGHQQQMQVASPNPQEQRGQQQPKRYSSMRRTQHTDGTVPQHISEQHQIQSQMMLPDQHILQANLMQLYHQENLQAQMQALQVNPAAAAVPPNVAKPGAYAVAPNAPQAAPSFYVAPNEAYNPAAAATSATYAPQPMANYLPQGTAGTVPYGPASNASSAAAVAQNQAPPTAAPTSVVPANATGPNYPNYAQNFNTVGGTTYFVPPPQTRPAALPQRRPTNAIPILPPEKNSNKQRNAASIAANESSTKEEKPSLGSAENIDHILDNMFVQRPAFQPPISSVSNIQSVTQVSENDSQQSNNEEAANNISKAESGEEATTPNNEGGSVAVIQD